MSEPVHFDSLFLAYGALLNSYNVWFNVPFDHSTGSLQIMKDLNTLFTESIRRHEDILAMFETINHARAGCNPTTLHAGCTELLHLQEQVALADSELSDTMEKISPDSTAHPVDFVLVEQRKEIMRQIYIHNRSLLASIQNIQSLLAHEIKEMQGGRTAMNGYRQAIASRQGSILNESR